MYLTELGWETVKWIHMLYQRNLWQALLNTAKNIEVVKNAGIFLSS
jgi:hypothetical protein